MANRQPHPARFMDYPRLKQNAPVTASSMAHDFKTIPAAAQAHYEKKRIDIEGVVRYNGPDMYGLPSIELSDGVDGPCEVLCVFEDEGDIDGISVGSTVTIRGNFIGVAPQVGPTFKRCEVVDS